MLVFHGSREHDDVARAARCQREPARRGFNVGKTTTDNCEIADKVPESLIAATNPSVLVPFNYCHTETPWLTQWKGNGAYTVPKVDVLVSATFASVQGPPVRADLTVSSRPDGTPLNYGTQATATLPVNFGNVNNPTSSEYGERLNQLDLRFGKLVRLNGVRATVNFDLFNVFNGNAVTRENSNYAAFRQPTEIMLARYAKIGMQIDF